ncbi:hypothetical protein [Crateriforma conspicua]|uniref:hypothetical protein n=1 Tax=Crateriforma conspicua TaxID=2527996 RepID=UPI00118AEFCB|nr:hypothetical protein [Crateriforma conspicua]QDV63045.1 hypothetical protein Mal65_21840 [Crateriforma conspicua]
MNIVDAVKDPHLFRPFLLESSDGDKSGLDTWQNWITALKVVYGLPLRRRSERELVKRCTGRSARHLPKPGFNTSIFLTGRRSGKSRNAAIIGAYEAVIAGHEDKLAKGERGVVAVCAPSKSQGRVVKEYLRAVFDSDLLRDQVVNENRWEFELKNGNRIEILSGDWRTIRGYTLISAIVDEACFFGIDSESKVKNDTELVRAIAPGLASVGGRMVLISSPYAMKGYCYHQHKVSFGNESAPVLVWNCPSRVMNPSLPQSVVDQAYRDDPVSAKAEYGGEFRDDVCGYVSVTALEQVVIKDRTSLMPNPEARYSAFADLSGGRNDDAAIAIGHREENRVVQDFIKRYPAPFNPHAVIGDMSRILNEYKITKLIGDNYAGEFVVRAFKDCGVRYRPCKPSKSILYADLLPWITSERLELLDEPMMFSQLVNLERRTRSGGRDQIDHPVGGHDDLANVVAGMVHSVVHYQPRIARAL